MSNQDSNFDFTSFFGNDYREDIPYLGEENDFFRANSFCRSNYCELEETPSYLETPQQNYLNNDYKPIEKEQTYECHQPIENQEEIHEFATDSNLFLGKNPSDIDFFTERNKIEVQNSGFELESFQTINYEPQPSEKKSNKITIIIEIDDALYETATSLNGRQEDSNSVTTKDKSDQTEKDQLDFQTEVSVGENNLNLNFEWKSHILNNIRNKSEDEKAYVSSIMPALLESLQNAVSLYNPDANMTKSILDAVVKDLIHGKEYMIQTENKHLKTLIHQEIDEIRQSCPKNMIEVDDLYESKRKSKKSTKGNVNHSSMNHMNENYVSNIFQFSKQNFLEDKEIQRIANTRNVSATNFKKLTKTNLTDGIMVRKAKVRILASGKELISNVEYWMNDGYFNQCNEKEKYIIHKNKAVSDLALE